MNELWFEYERRTLGAKHFVGKWYKGGRNPQVPKLLFMVDNLSAVHTIGTMTSR